MKQDSNNCWEQLERLEKLIRASELKAGIIFSFHSLILGLVADRLGFFNQIFTDSILLIVLSILWICSVLISVFFCFKCFRPRIELKYDPNVFFFKNAVNKFGDVKEYSKKLLEVCGNEEELCTQLSQQIHVESKIIDQKFNSVNQSLKYFALSIIFVILILVLSLIKI